MRYVILGVLAMMLVPASVDAGDRRSSSSGFSVGIGHSERWSGDSHSSGWGGHSRSSRSGFEASVRFGSDRYERNSHRRYDYGHDRGYRHDYDRYDRGRHGYNRYH